MMMKKLRLAVFATILFAGTAAMGSGEFTITYTGPNIGNSPERARKVFAGVSVDDYRARAAAAGVYSDYVGNYTYINDYYMYGRDAVPHEHVVIKGSFTVDGDIITVHNDYETISMDGGPAEEIEWEPYDEQMKYSINGNTLHLVRQYGTEYSWEEDWTKQ